MSGNHLLLTLRTLRKNLLYGIFVVAGLALGITTFLATIQWSAWHLTFDRSYPDRQRLYRLTFEERSEGFYRHTARIIHGDILNQIMFTDMISGIECRGRIAPFRKAALIIGENSYYGNYVYECDPGFLEIFRPPVLEGREKDLLSEPHTAAITVSTARRFFGNEDPIGQSFELIHQFGIDPVSYTIVAVIGDFPGNSHLEIDLLTAFDNPVDYSGTAWTYLKLEPGTDAADVESGISEFLRNNVESGDVEEITPMLQPVTAIHLHSHKEREIKPNIRYRTVLIMIIAGMMVFLLAWFNFTLITFSHNQLNIKGLVVQWQMGAGRKDFYRQFLTDNLTVGFMAYFFGIMVTLVLIPVIEKTVGTEIFSDWRIILLSFLSLLLLIVTGSFFAALISTGRLYRHLQHRYLASKSGPPPDQTGKNLFIRAVILFEYIITFVLITNLFMISRQTGYAMSEQLGAAQANVIQLDNLHRAVVDKFRVFKKMMLENHAVAEVTASMEEPTGEAVDANTFEINGVDEGDKQLYLFPVDEDFIRFYDLEILYGSDFPEIYDPEDSTEYFVLNETAAKMVSDSIGDLIGRELTLHFAWPGLIWPGPITGIVKDFHLSGLDYEISPMVIFPKYVWLWCFTIKPSGDPAPAVEHLKKVWKDLFPSLPLDYRYTSDLIENLYHPELVQMRVLVIFCILSFLITGMGLFALSGFFMHRRLKSSALRKVHGARLYQVILPELALYIWLALLSSALSIPGSILLMERWLRNFKYRVDIPAWIFPASLAFLIFFSWLAVFYHTWRLATINPAEFIRDE